MLDVHSPLLAHGPYRTSDDSTIGRHDSSPAYCRAPAHCLLRPECAERATAKDVGAGQQSDRRTSRVVRPPRRADPGTGRHGIVRARAADVPRQPDGRRWNRRAPASRPSTRYSKCRHAAIRSACRRPASGRSPPRRRAGTASWRPSRQDQHTAEEHEPADDGHAQGDLGQHALDDLEHLAQVDDRDVGKPRR